MVTREGGGSRQMVTNGDKGGWRVKNWDFYGDLLCKWPLSVESEKIIVPNKYNGSRGLYKNLVCPLFLS